MSQASAAAWPGGEAVQLVLASLANHSFPSLRSLLTPITVGLSWTKYWSSWNSLNMLNLEKKSMYTLWGSSMKHWEWFVPLRASAGHEAESAGGLHKAKDTLQGLNTSPKMEMFETLCWPFWGPGNSPEERVGSCEEPEDADQYYSMPSSGYNMLLK